MYSQANVRAGEWLRPPLRALPSVILDTEKGVAGSGWVREAGRGKTGVRPGVRLKSRTVRAGEEPEEHKRYKEFLEMVGNGSRMLVLQVGKGMLLWG